MIEIPANFPTKYENNDVNCKQCGKTENMKHVYMCNMNHENKDIQYEKIFGDNRKQMKRIYKQLKANYENRENMKMIENPPRDPFCDPLISSSEFSKGPFIYDVSHFGGRGGQPNCQVQFQFQFHSNSIELR